MREYYRWETGKAFSDSLNKGSISQWLCEKESSWESLEDEELHSIEINQMQYNPYDAELINSEIIKYDYIYSSGLGMNCRPHFFLGSLLKHFKIGANTVYISGKEIARDLPSPPAVSLNNNIFIRRESVKRMIWEKIDEWKLESNNNIGFQRVFGLYDMKSNLEQSLNQITNNEINSMILHEQGEIHAQSVISKDWHKMLMDLPRSPAHFLVRAVRDHIADCKLTLPQLFKENGHESIHFYFGNFSSVRKKIFPSLRDNYDLWHESNNSLPLLELCDKAYIHWCNIADSIVDCWRLHGTQSSLKIEKLITQNTL